MSREELMIDLETYGVGPRALVLSVGAVAFTFSDKGWAERMRYRAVLDREEQIALDREVDPSTVAWWAKQSPEARAVLDEPQLPLMQALAELRVFVMEHTVGELRLRPWGNGADFDLVILSTLYRDALLQPPWRYHQQRCFRTLKSMFPREYEAAKVTVGGNAVRHDALADAEWQAKVAYEMWQAGCLWGRE